LSHCSKFFVWLMEMWSRPWVCIWRTIKGKDTNQRGP
jgi:hypothetical protein